jgi:hypothetical protein
VIGSNAGEKCTAKTRSKTQSNDHNVTKKSETTKHELSKKKKSKKTKAKVAPCPVPVSHIKVEKSQVDVRQTQDWKSHLHDHGWVVISEVISEIEHLKMMSHWRADLRALGTGVDLSNAATLTKSRLPGIASIGIFKDPAAGWAHSRTAYEARRLTKHIFASLYGTEDLQTSFDGASLFPNWSIPELSKSKTKTSWLHIDQGSTLGSGSMCVQGMLNLMKADAYTGGIVVVDKSHQTKIHKMILEHTRNKSNYITLDFHSVEIANLVKETGLSLLCAPARSVILWDSRLIHTNHCAMKKPEHTNPVLRMNNYICMTPRRHDVFTVRTRETMLMERRQTNHWPFMTSSKGPLRKCHLAYPRHKTFESLTSCALDLDVIRDEYADML